MGCINPDGSLTASAKQMLKLLAQPHTPEDAATASGLPLFKVRASLRDMSVAKLVEERDGLYVTTTLGRKLVEGIGEAPAD